MKKILFILSFVLLSAMAVNAQSTKRMLDNAILLINRGCPVALDEDTMLKKAYLTSIYLVFDCDFEEKEVDILTASEHKKELKEVFRKMLDQMAHDENTAALFELVAANKKGVEFRLKGKTTKKTLEIKFSAPEIAEVADYTYMNY